MAVDSRNKRSSATSVLRMWDANAPLADGTIGEYDRLQVAAMYSGISAGAAPTEVLAAQMRASFRMVFGRVLGRVN